MKIFKSKKSGQALVYAMLFIILIGVTVGLVLTASNSDIALQRRSENAEVAYQQAKMGLDHGWADYKNAIGTAYPLVDKTIPSNACLSGSSRVNRVFPNNSLTTTNVPFTTATPKPDAQNGSYDYRICTDGSTHVTTIQGVGYYKGNKITLKGIVTHNDVTIPNPCVPSPGIPTCTGLDHSNDTLTISQEGPFQ